MLLLQWVISFIYKHSKTPILFVMMNKIIKVIKIGITDEASKTSLSKGKNLCPIFFLKNFVSMLRQNLFCISNECCNFLDIKYNRNYNKDYSEVKTLFKAGLNVSPYLNVRNKEFCIIFVKIRY